MTDQTSNRNSPLHPSDAFVRKFGREPNSPSDCAWINGYAEALTSTSGTAPTVTDGGSAEAGHSKPKSTRELLESASNALQYAGPVTRNLVAGWIDEALSDSSANETAALPMETGLRPGELAQLRRIDAAARFYVDSISRGQKKQALDNLQKALFDGRPVETTAPVSAPESSIVEAFARSPRRVETTCPSVQANGDHDFRPPDPLGPKHCCFCGKPEPEKASGDPA